MTDKRIAFLKNCVSYLGVKTPNWDLLQALHAVGREGTLTAAARTLGVSVPTLGRRLDRLDDMIGLKTTLRTPQGVQLTDAGRTLAETLDSGAEHLAQFARSVRGLHQSPAWLPIRISSTEPILSDVLAPRLGDLLDARPRLRLEMESSLELSRLDRGEADIAVRMVKPASDTLIARRLRPISLGLYASETFVERHGSRFDPSQMRLLWYDSAYGDIAENRALASHGWEAAATLRAGSVRTLQRAAEASVGVAPLPHFLARTSGLRRLDAPKLPTRTPWMVFHRETRRGDKVGFVRNWIARCFAALDGIDDA